MGYRKWVGVIVFVRCFCFMRVERVVYFVVLSLVFDIVCVVI